MADVKCPMCSKPNPEGAEVCEFCGARLKPLTVDDGDFDAGQGPAEPEEGQVPDWLARIRERAEEEAPEPEPPSEGPDWLSRLRSAEAEEPGPPEDDIPDWLSEEAEEEPAEPEDDWLGRLRATAGGPEPSPAEEEAQEEPAPPEDEEGVPEVGSGALEEPVLEEAEPEPTDVSPPLAPEADEAADFELDAIEAEIDQAFDFSSDEFGDSDGELAASEEALEPTAPEDRPEWFDEVKGAAEPEAPAWEPPETEEPPVEAGPEMGLVEGGEPEQEAELAAAGLEGEAAAEEAEDEADWEGFDWESFELAAEGVDDGGPEIAPFPDEPGDDEEESLPHVPALIVGESGEEDRDVDIDEFDLDAIELPDWLSDVKEGEEPAPVAAADEGSSDLAPATIPSWLEAMRPVETFQPVVDLGSEEEQSVETVGPLAGLRGVLLAEPVVAKPHTSTSTGERLQVTERQYAQAELLRRIVEQEDQELGSLRSEGRKFPLVRWLISLALVVAVLLPPVMGVPHYDTPKRVSRDLGPLIQVVNNVPVDRPALLVFDYEPGYTAELSGVAGALLENLLARGVSVVTLSTRPSGPPLALELVGEIGASHGIENGRDYVHLGYLSGGPTAVQLFSAAPKSAILKGFMLPADMQARTPWDLPVLRDVSALSDFGMVAVLAAGTDTARTWAEQASPWLDGRPLVMVLSTGAEPLIRPYFESQDPQVDGILAGLPAAVAYEEINGRPGAALGRWDAFGAGTLAVELVLLAGVAYGVAGWVIALRRERE
jgi:hypothetical protein